MGFLGAALSAIPLVWLGIRLNTAQAQPDPAQPRIELLGQTGGTVDVVAVDGDRAWFSQGPRIAIADVGDPSAPQLLGSTEAIGWRSEAPPEGERLPESIEAGFRDIAIDGDWAFAIDGRRLFLLDGREPSLPRVSSALPMEGARALDQSGRRLFVAGSAGDPRGQTGSWLRVYDLSSPDAPDLVSTTELNEHASPNLELAVEDGLAVVGLTNILAEDRLVVLDVAEGAQPRVLSAFSPGGNFRAPPQGLAFGGRHATVILDDVVALFDLSEPSSPELISSFRLFGGTGSPVRVGDRLYVASRAPAVDLAGGPFPPRWPQVGELVRPRTLSDRGERPRGVHPAAGRKPGRRAAPDFETEGVDALNVFDLSDLARPTYRGRLLTDGSPRTLAVAGSVAYLAAGGDGLRLVDLSQPDGLVETGGIDAADYRGPVSAGGGLVIATLHISDRSGDGIAILEDAEPSPRELARLRLSVDGQGMRVRSLLEHDGLLFVATEPTTGEGPPILQVMDIGQPSRPERVQRLEGVGSAIAHSDGYLIVAAERLEVFDLQSPSALAPIASLDLGFAARSLAVSDGIAYAVGDELAVIDLRLPMRPELLGRVDLPASGQAVAAGGSWAIVLAWSPLSDVSIIVLDAAYRPEPRVRAWHEHLGHDGAVHVVGRTAWAPWLGRWQGIDIVSGAELSEPAWLGIRLGGLAGDDGRLHGASFESGLWSFALGSSGEGSSTATLPPVEEPTPIATAVPTIEYDPDGPEPMWHARSRHAMVELSDGRLLVGGGQSRGTVHRSVEIFDPESGGWNMVTPMHWPRMDHRMLLLPDGTVLVTGGVDAFGDAQGRAERYDPRIGVWRHQSRAIGRYEHALAPLPDGRVLVAGGRGMDGRWMASAEIFDPVTDAWKRIPDVPLGPGIYDAFPLASGRVLIVDAYGAGATFDPATTAWLRTGPERVDRNLRLTDHASALLHDGVVLRTGGSVHNEPVHEATGSSRRALRLDPVAGVWEAEADLPQFLESHLIADLEDGRVLIAGGETFVASDFFTGRFPRIETFALDRSAHEWTQLGNMRVLQSDALAHRLRDGSVLAVGGRTSEGDLATVQRFDPATGAWSIGRRPTPPDAFRVFLPQLARNVSSRSTRLIQLTDGPLDEWQAGMSADGRTVAYLAQEPERGLSVARLINADTLAVAGHMTGHFEQDGPFFSAAGEFLYTYRHNFQLEPGSAARGLLERHDLHRCDPRGWCESELLDWPVPPDARRLALSPDGRSLAYDAQVGAARDIFLLDLISGQVSLLTDDPAEDRLPTFSPDGRTILFRSERDGNSEIYRIAVDGQDLRRLTHDPGTDTYASFAPDGLEIVFQSDRSGQEGVYRMDTNGTTVREVTDRRARYLTPRFAPDGRSLLLSSDLAGQGDLDVYLLRIEGGGLEWPAIGSSLARSEE